MNEIVLNHFRRLAAQCAKREKQRVEIILSNGRVLYGEYDPMFELIIVGGSTFPVGEVSHWTRLFWGSEVVKIQARKDPVQSQAEN